MIDHATKKASQPLGMIYGGGSMAYHRDHNLRHVANHLFFGACVTYRGTFGAKRRKKHPSHRFGTAEGMPRIFLRRRNPDRMGKSLNVSPQVASQGGDVARSLACMIGELSPPSYHHGKGSPCALFRTSFWLAGGPPFRPPQPPSEAIRGDRGACGARAAEAEGVPPPHRLPPARDGEGAWPPPLICLP